MRLSLAFESGYPHDGMLSSQSLCRMLPKFDNSHLSKKQLFVDAIKTPIYLGMIRSLPCKIQCWPILYCKSGIAELIRSIGISINGVYHLDDLESYTKKVEVQNCKCQVQEHYWAIEIALLA